MLIRSKVANTTSPAMTQISIAMPNISPPKIASSYWLLASIELKPLIVCSAGVLAGCPEGIPPSAVALTTRHKACHHVQVTHDPLRFVVPKKNLAVRSPDVYHLVAPHIGLRTARFFLGTTNRSGSCVTWTW